MHRVELVLSQTSIMCSLLFLSGTLFAPHSPRCDLSHVLQVYGLPTFVMIKNGEEVKGSHYEGAVTKPMLVDYVKKFL